MNNIGPTINQRGFTQKDKLVVLLIFLLAMAATVGLGLLGKGKSPVNQLPPLKPSRVGEFRGIALQMHNGDTNHPYEEYIEQISRTGANSISIVFAAYQQNCSSTSIFVDLRRTPGDEHIKRLIRFAHARKLRVILMPIVLLENPGPKEWRGKIAPAGLDGTAWWKSYSTYILRYARIAQETGAAVFIVGSELVKTVEQEDRWRRLIARVREVYDGRLSYSANWDNYQVVKFWDALDIIGMQTYHDLVGSKKPTLDVMMSSWKGIRKGILDWRRKNHPKMPIMFTEVGWPNLTTCAKEPWDYTKTDLHTAPQLQARCFEAFFRTWINEDAVAGFIVWEWQNHPSHDFDPKTDKSYVPKGKPAMKVIQKYFQHPGPQRKATTAPARTSPITNRTGLRTSTAPSSRGR